jgi:polar amino acid transport system permease protein
MGGYIWNWHVVSEYWPAFIAGGAVSIAMTVVIVTVGTLVGTVVGIILASTNAILRPARWTAVAYVELLRALPVLVLLVYLHYVVPQSSRWLYTLFLNLDHVLRPYVAELPTSTSAILNAILTGIASRPFATAAVALALNLSAFVAEIIRNGIENVPRPLIDAAKSLGMNWWVCLRRVVLPETFRASVVGLIAMYITMFKFTTLAAFIGCSELMNVVYSAGNRSYRYLELYTMLAVAYLVILVPCMILAKLLERSRWLQRRS